MQKKRSKPWSSETPAYRPETWWDRLGKKTVGVPNQGLFLVYAVFATFVCLQIMHTSANGVEGDKGTSDLFLGNLSRWGIQYQITTNYLWYGLAAVLVVAARLLNPSKVERVVNRILFVLLLLFIVWYATRPTP